MKKILVVIAIASLGVGLQSCTQTKSAPADQLVTEESTEATAPVAPPMAEEGTQELVKTAQSKPLTNLVLSEDTFNFGDIKKGEHREHKYEVTNMGKNPLIISAVKPGCGCTVPDYTKDPILPGQKGYITLNFDSSNFDGAIHKQAEVFANVEKAPIVISFTGNVVP